MRIQYEHRNGSSVADISVVFDLTLPVRKTGNVSCYHLEGPVFSYFESPEFSGDLSKGGSVNCERIAYYAHASGTHTECALHVLPAAFDMRHISIPPLLHCLLLTVDPVVTGSDRVIDMTSLSGRTLSGRYDAVVFRTMPNPESKRQKDHSGTNPPYFDPEVLLHLREAGFRHILTDLPSIDRESDEGRLAAHKNWFLDGETPDPTRTITELIYVPDEVPDGTYALNMQVPSVQTDAVPSRIILYPCV